MGLGHSKDGRDGGLDCMACTGDDLQGCFAHRRPVQLRGHTAGRDSLNTPRFHGTQGVLAGKVTQSENLCFSIEDIDFDMHLLLWLWTVSSPVQNGQQQRAYIPEYTEVTINLSPHWGNLTRSHTNDLIRSHTNDIHVAARQAKRLLPLVIAWNGCCFCLFAYRLHECILQ